MTDLTDRREDALYERVAQIIEAAREGWATRELERQIASLLYERLAKSRDKAQVMALAKEGQRARTRGWVHRSREGVAHRAEGPPRRGLAAGGPGQGKRRRPRAGRAGFR